MFHIIISGVVSVGLTAVSWNKGRSLGYSGMSSLGPKAIVLS